MPNLNQNTKPKKFHHSQKTSIATLNTNKEIIVVEHSNKNDGSDVLSPNKSTKNSFSSNKQRRD